MTHGVFLVLPAHSLALVAESTSEPSALFLQEVIIRLCGCKAALDIGLFDLRLGEVAHEGFHIHTVPEYLRDPCRCRALASLSLASPFQFHRIGFVLRRWLFARAIENGLLRSMKC